MLALAMALLAGFPSWAEEAFVGSVKIVEGKPEIVRGADTFVALPGMRLEVKDSLRTDGSSKLGVILRDGTRISLGPTSELSLETFLFEPGKGELGLVLKLLRGIAAFVSGKIAALAPDSAKVETPVGMIGLRGTKFAIALGIR